MLFSLDIVRPSLYVLPQTFVVRENCLYFIKKGPALLPASFMHSMQSKILATVWALVKSFRTSFKITAKHFILASELRFFQL